MTLSAIGVAASLVLAELALTVLGIAQPVWSQYYPRYYFAPDARLGFVPTPGFSQRWFGVDLSNNSMGLRDVEHRAEKQPGITRILGVGDSQTWGALVAAEATYLRLLPARLAELIPGADVEVLAGGVPGYASDQALERLQAIAPRIRPDVVVFGLYADYVYGDLPRLLAHRRYGLHRVYDGYLVAPSLARDLGRGGFGGLRARLWVLMTAHSHLWTLGRSLWSQPLETPEFNMPLRQLPVPAALGALDLSLRSLDGLRAACRDIGAEPILLLIPARVDLDAESPVAAACNDRLVEHARGLGVATLDLRASFRLRVREGLPLYFADGHLSPLGHQLAAAELGLFLARSSQALQSAGAAARGRPRPRR